MKNDDLINKKNGKRGFTLIELMAILIILALIVMLSSTVINNIFDDVEKRVDKTTKNVIISAANDYVHEYRNKNGWKENVANNGDITFCVSMNSLLDTGYYDYDDEYIIKNKDKLFVSVLINNNKVFNYDLIGLDDVYDQCMYTLSDSNLNRTDGQINIKDDNDDKSIGSLGYKIDEIDSKNYDVDIDFLAELGIDTVEMTVPVYVAIVLDNSGSMYEDSWGNAKDAAIQLSNTIINDLADSQVALIQYNDTPVLSRNFENKSLNNNDFIYPHGGTNVSGSIDLVSSLYKNLDIPDYAMLYTILLYDGEPNYVSYLTYDKNKRLYNLSSNWELYYDNFLSAFNGINSSYKYAYNYYSNNISGGLSSYDFIMFASDYLKSKNINSKLISIGYNFDKIDERTIKLKEISSIDNKFCVNSDYMAEVNKVVDTNLISIDSIDMKTHQITYPFAFNVTDKSISSLNKGLMTESYGYYELDLIEYKSTDEIELKIDYSISSTRYRDYLLIIIDETENRSESKFTASACYTKGWKSYSNSYEFCDYSSGITKTNIMGGKKYYVHIYYEQNASDDIETIKVNSISYSLITNKLIYDSSVSGYTNDFVYLSSIDESKLVFEPIVKNNSLGLSGQAVNSYSSAYEEIDLTDKEGTYLLSVNAKSNNGMGVIYVSNSKIAPFPPAQYKQVGSISQYNFDNYALSTCNSSNLRCLFLDTSDVDFNFELIGGKKYYVHFINVASKKSINVENLIINNISLHKLGAEINDVVIDDISGDICSDASLDYISCLKKSDKYEFSFLPNNGSIISSNKEIKDSCSHNYTELDLSNYNNDDILIVQFNSTISSASGSSINISYSDFGNIIISESSDAPILNNMACDIREDNDCISIFSGISSRNSYAKLIGGKKYYIHFMYCKNTNGSYNDYFSINKIKIYKGIDNLNTNFPVDTSLGFTDVVNYNNYSFKEENGSLISTNEGIGNSLSHRYLKIDLSSYGSDERFLIEVDDFASHSDTGMIIMTEYEKMPSYYNFTSYSNGNIVISSNSGNDVDITTNSRIVNGGSIYYLHFIYAKGASGDGYGDFYRIDDVRIFHIVTENTKKLDFSKDKYHLKNYQFIKNNDKYISSNDDVYTSSYSYFELDLSNYSKNRKFNLEVNATFDDKDGFAVIYVSPSDGIPWFFYNSGFDKIIRHKVSAGNENYYTELQGGQKYYIHFSSTNRGEKVNYSINSVKLNEFLLDKVDYYCYYDASVDNINTVFSNLSNKVNESVPKLAAKSADIILTTKIDNKVAFHIEDKDGNLVDTITETIDLSSYELTDVNYQIKFDDKYRFVLDDDIKCNEEICTLKLKLFDINLKLYYDDDSVNIIELDDEMIPIVEIKIENGEAIN